MWTAEVKGSGKGPCGRPQALTFLLLFQYVLWTLFMGDA